MMDLCSGDAEQRVALPVERLVDDDAFRHAPALSSSEKERSASGSPIR
jgi:hypothetical protein